MSPGGFPRISCAEVSILSTVCSRRLFFIAALSAVSTASASGVAPTKIIALTGQQVPGAPDGVTFLDFHSHGQNMYPAPPVINATGRAAFWGHVTGPNVTTSND